MDDSLLRAKREPEKRRFFEARARIKGCSPLINPKVEQNPPKSGGVPFGTNAFPISGIFNCGSAAEITSPVQRKQWGSTCSSVNAQQGDGGDLVAQGLEALGGVVIGGELQNVLSGGVCVLRQGQNDALAVCQTLTGQILALVLRTDSVQVQLGDVGAGGVVHGVLSGLHSSLRACSLGRSGSRGSHRRGGHRRGSRGSGRGRRTASGHADGQCQSSSHDSSMFQFMVMYSPCL